MKLQAGSCDWGTSAGASVMSSTMIVEGDSERAPPQEHFKDGTWHRAY